MTTPEDRNGKSLNNVDMMTPQLQQNEKSENFLMTLGGLAVLVLIVITILNALFGIFQNGH